MNLENPLFSSVGFLVRNKANDLQKALFKSFFHRLYLVGTLDRSVATAVFKDFKSDCNALRKTEEEKACGGEKEKGAEGEKERKRAEEATVFWAYVAVLVLHKAKEERFPLLSVSELIELFPEFEDVQSDLEEMGRLSKFHRFMAATMQAIDPAKKKGMLIKVAGRLESVSVYVTGGGASPQTKRRALIYDRLCSLSLVDVASRSSDTSSISIDEDSDEECSVLGKRQRISSDCGVDSRTSFRMGREENGMITKEWGRKDADLYSFLVDSLT